SSSLIGRTTAGSIQRSNESSRWTRNRTTNIPQAHRGAVKAPVAYSGVADGRGKGVADGTGEAEPAVPPWATAGAGDADSPGPGPEPEPGPAPDSSLLCVAKVLRSPSTGSPRGPHPAPAKADRTPAMPHGPVGTRPR